MGTIPASRVLSRAATTLFDESGVRWSEPELLDYLNAGISAVIAAKPDAASTTVPLQLQPGTLQTIPEHWIQLLGVVRNLGADGLHPGRVVRQIERAELDNHDPDWHRKVGSEVHHFVSDARLPREFYVFPAAAGWVEVQAVVHPGDVHYPEEIIPLDDIYENPLHNWVVGYAYAKSTKSGDLGKSMAYLTLFSNALGLRMQRQLSFAPPDPDVATKTGGDG